MGSTNFSFMLSAYNIKMKLVSYYMQKTKYPVEQLNSRNFISVFDIFLSESTELWTLLTTKTTP